MEVSSCTHLLMFPTVTASFEIPHFSITECLQDHPRTKRKWLVTMVIVSSLSVWLFPFQMAFFCLMNGWVTNHLRPSWMILQVLHLRHVR